MSQDAKPSVSLHAGSSLDYGHLTSARDNTRIVFTVRCFTHTPIFLYTFFICPRLPCCAFHKMDLVPQKYHIHLTHPATPINQPPECRHMRGVVCTLLSNQWYH